MQRFTFQKLANISSRLLNGYLYRPAIAAASQESPREADDLMREMAAEVQRLQKQAEDVLAAREKFSLAEALALTTMRSMATAAEDFIDARKVAGAIVRELAAESEEAFAEVQRDAEGVFEDARKAFVYAIWSFTVAANVEAGA